MNCQRKNLRPARVHGRLRHEGILICRGAASVTGGGQPTTGSEPTAAGIGAGNGTAAHDPASHSLDDPETRPRPSELRNHRRTALRPSSGVHATDLCGVGGCRNRPADTGVRPTQHTFWIRADYLAGRPVRGWRAATSRCQAEGGVDRREMEHVRSDHRLQQFLRVRHRQGRSEPVCRPAQDQPVDRDGRRPLRQAGRLRRRGSREAAGPRRAGLPPALRRGMVDGHSLDRRAACRNPAEGSAEVKCRVRRVHDASEAAADARPVPADPPVALHRRTATGRSDASAHDRGCGAVWEDAPQPERRAAPPRGAVEVRLQEHQVDRPDPLRVRAAPYGVEHRECRRVRLLREREPRGGSSALESGSRAAPAGDLRPSSDTDVQRLRRSGGVDVFGNGPGAGSF